MEDVREDTDGVGRSPNSAEFRMFRSHSLRTCSRSPGHMMPPVSTKEARAVCSCLCAQQIQCMRRGQNFFFLCTGALNIFKAKCEFSSVYTSWNYHISWTEKTIHHHKHLLFILVAITFPICCGLIFFIIIIIHWRIVTWVGLIKSWVVNS